MSKKKVEIVNSKFNSKKILQLFLANFVPSLCLGFVAGMIGLNLESEYVFLLSLYLTIWTLFWYIRIWHKHFGGSYENLGFRSKKMFKLYGSGLLIGTIAIFATVMISYLFGGVTIEICNNKVLDYLIILLYAVGYIFQGMEEEILCRGIILKSNSVNHSVFYGVIVNSLIFGLLHIANPGFGVLPFANLFLFGVFMSLMTIKDNSLWKAGAVHSIWNFMQGCFFGIMVSGNPKSTSILTTYFVEGKTLINGGLFGIEGSIATSIVLIVFILVLYMSLKKKSQEFIN